jgi:alkanesulfonate monooxygenase SsuD/methylene tetrahydromethanopterin reductase-like flavin-dependent oxidoreductase (luciferase family)
MTKTRKIRIGAAFPATEISSDRGQVRAFVEAVGDLGFDHILALDHVLGAYPPAYPEGPALQPLPGTSGWENIYDYQTTFHEPFVLFGFVAALTELEMFTGVLILPQRQTALVAKQAAQVDILSGGKLRLGVGIGWNKVEYDTTPDPSVDGQRVQRSSAQAGRSNRRRVAGPNAPGPRTRASPRDAVRRGDEGRARPG